MKRVFSSFLLGIILMGLVGCDTEYDNGEVVSGVTKLTVEKSNLTIPTLVIIMNWNNITEDGTDTFWHNKLFDTSSDGINSVNRWYANNTNNNITLVPAVESYGTNNDGVIRVNMGVDHFNKYNDDPYTDNITIFRNTCVPSALQKAKQAANINFQNFDTDSNGFVSAKELQIIFIVAGGEQSYGGPTPNATWAHSWNFDDNEAPPKIDNVTLLYSSSDTLKKGTYAAFGAQHRDSIREEHSATIGIMAHEIGHALYNLVDFYDTGYGSGLGNYDIMSDGIWGQSSANVEPGDTPVQFSAYNKLATSQHIVQSGVNGKDISLKCSANEFIKLPTANPKEYFLLECRDTAKYDSDRAFDFFDFRFTDNQLVAIAYHIDEAKYDLPAARNVLVNSENGPQTATHHYMDSVVERNSNSLMTDTAGDPIDFSDMYTEGYIIDSIKLKSYAGNPGFNVEVLSADYRQRTMHFRILK